MFFGGNWKLNGSRESIHQLTQELKVGITTTKARVVVFAPFVYLSELIESLKDSVIQVGAQNVSDQAEGAFTGEVSAAMLKDVGCDYVLIGHSERRSIYHEDDAMIARKMRLAIDAGLRPVLCVGETLDVREAGDAEAFVIQQLKVALTELNDQEIADIIVAYEPVWAIGTGQVATPEQAQTMHHAIRDYLSGEVESLAEGIDIIYGGSMKPDNASSLLSQDDINGGLIGGASLKASEFAAIIGACVV